MDDQELLRRAEDLCRRSEKKGIVTESTFLTPAERAMLEAKFHTAQGMTIRFFGGTEESERTVAFFFPEDMVVFDDDIPEHVKEQICAIQYRAYFGEPGHRDYLGALLASGISRDRLGDILIQGNTATVFCLTGIRSHLLTVDRIGRITVKAEQIALNSVQLPQKERKEKSISVMSMRLDAVAAGMFNLSRSVCARMINEGCLSLNYSVCLKTDAGIKEGDVISLRGYGKGKVTGIGGTSRKGRQFIRVERYL